MLKHKYNDDGTLRMASNYGNFFIPAAPPRLRPTPALQPAAVAAVLAPRLGPPVAQQGAPPAYSYDNASSRLRRNTVILTPQPEAGPSGLRRRSTLSGSSQTRDEDDVAAASEGLAEATVKRERAEYAEVLAAEEAKRERKRTRRAGKTEEERKARKKAKALRRKERAEKEERERHMRIAHEVTRQDAQRLAEQEDVTTLQASRPRSAARWHFADVPGIPLAYRTL